MMLRKSLTVLLSKSLTQTVELLTGELLYM